MKTVKNNKTYYFQCDCSSQEHTLGIEFDTEEKEVCFHVQLSQYRGFFGRLVVAVKYLFGYECKYGHWDTVLMNEEKFMDLYNLMGRYIQIAGFQVKGKLKIQKGLNDISKGKSNPIVPNGLHSEADRDIIQKRAKK